MNLSSRISYERQIDKFFRIFKVLPYRKAAPVYTIGNPSPRSFSRGTNHMGFDLYDGTTLLHIHKLSCWQIEHFSPLLLGMAISVGNFRKIAEERSALLSPNCFPKLSTYDRYMEISDIYKVLKTIEGG